MAVKGLTDEDKEERRGVDIKMLSRVADRLIRLGLQRRCVDIIDINLCRPLRPRYAADVETLT